MTWLNPVLVLSAAFLAVFVEATFDTPRRFLGVQIDLLPALMVYASLRSTLVTVTSLAVLGGLWFDTFSGNPLGITILPLFIAGFLIHPRRELILREQYYARFALGFAAGALVPLLTLLLLMSTRREPIVGWGTLWQWLVLAFGGGLLTPVCFWVLDGLNRALTYRPSTGSSFRPDREIKRGRN